MNIKNCKECGKIFQYVFGQEICKDCADKLEDKYRQVREYIYQNPGVSIQKVSQEMDVKTSVIYRWLQEERFQAVNQSNFDVRLENKESLNNPFSRF